MEIVTQNEFKSIVSTGITFVDFYADWCRPCTNLMDVITRVIEPEFGEVRFVKVNIEDNPELTREHAVKSVPTMFVYKDGEIQEVFNGVANAAVIKATIQKYVTEGQPESGS